jgi:hypothetical protein
VFVELGKAFFTEDEHTGFKAGEHPEEGFAGVQILLSKINLERRTCGDQSPST